jgi:hypothetical protein
MTQLMRSGESLTTAPRITIYCDDGPFGVPDNPPFAAGQFLVHNGRGAVLRDCLDINVT